MKHAFQAIMVVAALAAATPVVAAERASLAERVAALEQASANSGQGNVELLNQVAALRADVQSLRGELEQLQQQLEQERESSKNQYLDTDGRLTGIKVTGGDAVTRLVPLDTAPVGRRIGVARGRFAVPDDIDAHNADVAHLFAGGRLS